MGGKGEDVMIGAHTSDLHSWTDGTVRSGMLNESRLGTDVVSSFWECWSALKCQDENIKQKSGVQRVALTGKTGLWASWHSYSQGIDGVTQLSIRKDLAPTKPWQASAANSRVEKHGLQRKLRNNKNGGEMKTASCHENQRGKTERLRTEWSTVWNVAKRNTWSKNWKMSARAAS